MKKGFYQGGITMKKYGVIMAGGGGARFWPLSRKVSPKQILNLSGKDVMINETINRINPIIPYSQTIIVTNKLQEKIIKEVIVKIFLIKTFY